MATAVPILRIFDYDKAIEFYVRYLGFQIDWEHKPDDAPSYFQVSFQGIVIHLTEHHGDCCPGARIHIDDFNGLGDYHRTLQLKGYKFMNPGIEQTPWNPKTLCVEVTDPFGNRLTFTGEG